MIDGQICENSHYCVSCRLNLCPISRCADLILGDCCGQLVACDCPCTGGPA